MTKRHLRCACCDGNAGRYEQYWNQDTGYGICRPCLDWMTSKERRWPITQDEVLDYYGKAGINYQEKKERDHDQANS